LILAYLTVVPQGLPALAFQKRSDADDAHAACPTGIEQVAVRGNDEFSAAGDESRRERSVWSPAASWASCRMAGPAEGFTAGWAGAVRRRADQVQGVIADFTGPLPRVAVFAWELLQLADEGIPIQHEQAFAFAALDAHREPLRRHYQFQGL
jgi:hypothetical protein